MCPADDLVSVMHQASQGEKQAVQQKSHPQHIESGQHISRKICSIQQGQNRILLCPHSVHSQNCRHEDLHPCQDPPCSNNPARYCLTRASIFLHIPQRKWQQADHRKSAQGTIHLFYNRPCRKVPGFCHFFQIHSLSLRDTQSHHKQDASQEKSP